MLSGRAFIIVGVLIAATAGGIVIWSNVTGKGVASGLQLQPGDTQIVARGQTLYAQHCAVCHGDAGDGNGPVGTKFIPQPMNLTLDYVQLQPDGQLYYTISHGSIAMPFYRQAIPLQRRWDLVNYIKTVFALE